MISVWSNYVCRLAYLIVLLFLGNLRLAMLIVFLSYHLSPSCCTPNFINIQILNMRFSFKSLYLNGCDDDFPHNTVIKGNNSCFACPLIHTSIKWISFVSLKDCFFVIRLPSRRSKRDGDTVCVFFLNQASWNNIAQRL